MPTALDQRADLVSNPKRDRLRWRGLLELRGDRGDIALAQPAATRGRGEEPGPSILGVDGIADQLRVAKTGGGVADGCPLEVELEGQLANPAIGAHDEREQYLQFGCFPALVAAAREQGTVAAGRGQSISCSGRHAGRRC